QHHVWRVGGDPGDGLADGSGLPHHGDPLVGQLGKFGLDARAEQRVVVDQEHPHRQRHRPSSPSARPGHGCCPSPAARGTVMVSVHSVPPPGDVLTSAFPPYRSILPRIDSATPRRSTATAAGSNPRPRSRTNTEASGRSSSAYTLMVSTPACFAAFTIASRAAATSAVVSSVTGTSPTTTGAIATA